MSSASERVPNPPLFPYSERPGVGANVYTEILLAPPEVQLSGPEKTAAFAFAADLHEGQVNAQDSTLIVCEASGDLKKVYEQNTFGSEQTFFLDYFSTEKGQEDVLRLGIIMTNNTEAICERLNDLEAMSLMPDKTRREIAARSLKWQKAMLAERIAGWDTGQPDPESLTVNYDPDKLLGKLSDLQAFRRYYRDVWLNLKISEDSPLKKAKTALLEVHAARVNNLMSELYPQAVDLAIQLDRSQPTEQTEAWTTRLTELVPLLSYALGHDEADRQERLAAFSDGFARRLDLVRQGAADWGDPEYSPISHELTGLANRLDAAPPEESSRSRFAPDVQEVLDRTVWNADQTAGLVRAVLIDRGQFSAYTATWEEMKKRDGPAPDGRWQIVISPEKDSLNADPAKRVIVIGGSFNRTLTQVEPAGVLPVVAHETTHVEQNAQNEQLAKNIPLAGIRGRRYLTTREMGGIDQESEMQGILGHLRPINRHYLRALQAKLHGANQTEVAAVFYNSQNQGKELTPEADAEARQLAVDRTQRLYRKGGHNSQPLDYIEQELQTIVLEVLDEERRRAIMLACDSFSLADAAKLHRVGLLNIPTSVDARPAETVIRVFRKQFLGALLKDLR